MLILFAETSTSFIVSTNLFLIYVNALDNSPNSSSRCMLSFVFLKSPFAISFAALTNMSNGFVIDFINKNMNADNIKIRI